MRVNNKNSMLKITSIIIFFKRKTVFDQLAITHGNNLLMKKGNMVHNFDVYAFFN